MVTKNLHPERNFETSDSFTPANEGKTRGETFDSKCLERFFESLFGGLINFRDKVLESNGVHTVKLFFYSFRDFTGLLFLMRIRMLQQQ